ncbi:MAG: tetratricopeptide repeat protein, partial [Bacteroidales bacterium]
WACAIMLLGKYLLLLIFPYQQVCDYSFNQLPLVGFGSWQTLLSLLIYVALIIYAIRSLRKKSPVAYGIFFFIITMSIYSNLVYLIGSSFADRFLFIPSLGYCMAIVYLLYQYADKKSTQQASYITPSRLISGGLLIIMLLFFTVKTYTRSAEWENNFTLYGADIKKSENSARLNFLWGEALRDKAIEYQNKNNTPSPSAVLEKNSLMYRAYLWKSILAVKKGIAIYPKHANAYDRVGFAFYSLHPYYPKEGFLDSAVYYYSRALQLNPKSIITQYNIAIAYYNKGDYENAKNHYLYVVQSDTSEHVVRFDLGSSYAMLGKLDSARYHFTLYLQKHPEGAASCYSNLAIGYARINQLDSAIAMSKNTLNADPYNVSTYQLLSQIYSFRKQSDSAMLTINTLIALMPDNPTGYIEKGNLFRQINQADSANYYYMLGKSKQP